MAMTIFTGRVNKGNIPNVKEGNQLSQLFGEIATGNSLAVQNMTELNMVLAPMEREVPRRNDTPLPIKVHNVKFTKGGIQTSAPEFREYYDKFVMTKDMGYNTYAFDFDTETILEAENNSVNLTAIAQENLATIRGVYTERYLPLQRLKAMITGTTLTNNVPALDAGTGSYSTAFGWARGENYADYLTTAVGGDTRNHYRVVKGASVASTDLTDLIDSIENTNFYTGQGVLVLGAKRTINNLASIANAPENKDIAIFGNITDMFGAEFKSISGFHPDFLIMLDKGMLNKLLLRGVEEDPAQRGWGFVRKNKLTAFDTVYDLEGGKVRIFPEEWYQTWRLSGGILDVNGTRADVSGEMQDGVGNSVEALEAWVSRMTNYFEYLD